MVNPRRQFPVWILVVVVLILAFGGLLRVGIIQLPGYPVHAAPQVAVKTAPASQAPVTIGDFKNGFASIIDPALPAVVNISSTKIVKQKAAPDIFMNPLFRQFFGGQQPQQEQPREQREYSLGSGVIVNPDGFVLTNNHVVAGASDVEVYTQSHREYKAKVIGTDPRTDIAVLKIDASGLPTLTLGDSSKLKVGDLVFAIGDPFGIGETATMGIVSATGRALGGAIEHYEDFIQTDAAINPGNSGGALIDAHGDIVGINTAILSGGGGGGNEGVGFAIPIDLAHNIMNQIVEHGKVIRGYLGINIQAVNPDMAKAFGLSQGGGALVGDVTPNGPAAKGGLQRGDIILQLNGKPVAGPDDLSLRISELPPGSVARLQVYRNGKTQDMNITLGEYPENGTPGAAAPGQAPAMKGLQVQDLTPAIRQQLGLPAGSIGVVVTDVDPDSSAAAAGIKQGDVIQEVNHKPVRDVNQFEQAVAGMANQPVLLLIDRNGTTLFVVVEPQQ